MRTSPWRAYPGLFHTLSTVGWPSRRTRSDRDGFHRRAPATYRRWFAGAGLVHCGMQHYVTADTAGALAALDY